MANSSVSTSAGPRSASERWVRAAFMAVMIAALCYGMTAILSPKVADPGPADLRAQMAAVADDEADGWSLDEAIAQVNRMNVEDRRAVMRSAEAQRYFAKLKPAERMRFVKETLDRSIRQQIERYREMSKEEKAAFVEEAKERQREARTRMQDMPPEERKRMRAAMGDGNMEEIVEMAVKEYLKVSTSEERAELAPLFDGALDNLQQARELR